QQRPIILRVEFFLQLGELLDAFSQQIFCFPLEFRFEPAGITGVEISEPELPAFGHSITLDELCELDCHKASGALFPQYPISCVPCASGECARPRALTTETCNNGALTQRLAAKQAFFIAS